jgi:hypothetical protein
MRSAEWRSIPHSQFRIPYFLAVSGYLLTLLIFPVVASACPGCKEALFDPKEAVTKQRTALGYNLSIGLLLAVPATLVGATSALLIRASRKKRREARLN